MWTKFKNFFKDPPIWFIIPFYILTSAIITLSLVLTAVEKDFGIIIYIIYGFSAIFLAYAVYSVVICIPKIKAKAKAVIKRFDFLNRLYEQYGFRTIVFAVFSLAFSLFNAIFNGVVGILNLSVWYGALAAYYLSLSAMRSGVLLHHKNTKKLDDISIKKREKFVFLFCGVFLILLPVCLSVIISQTVASNRAFEHTGLMIYVSATYTFFKLITSCVHFFRARKTDKLTVKAIRNVNLADALVSILALQTALLHEFSEGGNNAFPNALTGAGVCVATASIGAFMLIKACIMLKVKDKNIAVSERNNQDLNSEEKTTVRTGK